jgi:hypothetical protein
MSTVITPSSSTPPSSTPSLPILFNRPRYRNCILYISFLNSVLAGKKPDGSYEDRLSTVHNALRGQVLYWNIKRQIQVVVIIYFLTLFNFFISFLLSSSFLHSLSVKALLIFSIRCFLQEEMLSSDSKIQNVFVDVPKFMVGQLTLT